MSKFIFDHVDNLEYHTDSQKDMIFNPTRKFTFDDGCIKSLRQNHRDFYKNIAERYIKNEQLFTTESYNNDYIVLNKALVNINGIIINSDKRIFINGGCVCGNTNNAFVGKISKEDSVISIAALWAGEIWHFPFEALVALKSIPKKILDNSKIHVSNIKPYVVNWFNLINIPSSQLITGSVYAKKMYIPRMGKCGNPYFSQIRWLQDIVHTPLEKCDYKYVILIKRTNRRPLRNYSELEVLLQNFCRSSDLELYIHDDSQLPSLTEQHQIFNRAKFVFAPHGAAGIHIIAMKPDSWYIEFLSKEDVNICYSRLAYFSDVNYIGLSMENLTIDMKKITETLDKIVRRVQYLG